MNQQSVATIRMSMRVQLLLQPSGSAKAPSGLRESGITCHIIAVEEQLAQLIDQRFDAGPQRACGYIPTLGKESLHMPPQGAARFGDAALHVGDAFHCVCQAVENDLALPEVLVLRESCTA